MRRRIAIVGVVLMVLAFAILTIFIIAPAIIMPLDNAPLLKSILQTAVCSPNETLTAGYSTYSTPGTSTTSIHYACVDAQQNARAVGDQIIAASGISYVVLFLAGLFTFLSASQDTGKRTKARPAAESSGLIARMTRGRSLESPAKAGKDKASFTPSMQDNPQPDHVPLAQQLRELKDALDEGLITEAEYKAKRLKLLD